MDKYLKEHVDRELFTRVEGYSFLSDALKVDLVTNAILAVQSYKHPLPEHHITKNGCSVCGTDAINCEALKSLKSTQNIEEK